jgi:hypothetical protein
VTLFLWPIAGVVSLTAGYYHTCAVLTGGSVYCWGDNSNGQLGTGDKINKLSPVAVSGLGTGKCTSVSTKICEVFFFIEDLFWLGVLKWSWNQLELFKSITTELIKAYEN